jgi:hypothetical protein
MPKRPVIFAETAKTTLALLESKNNLQFNIKIIDNSMEIKSIIINKLKTIKIYIVIMNQYKLKYTFL